MEINHNKSSFQNQITFPRQDKELSLNYYLYQNLSNHQKNSSFTESFKGVYTDHSLSSQLRKQILLRKE